MSEETWLKEFYPTPAASVKTRLEAIKHSLRKWKGAKKAALKKHKIGFPPWDFGHNSCALCHLYFTFSYDCSDDCPLVEINEKCTGIFGIAYAQWDEDGNPEPMIKALEKCLRLEKKKCKTRESGRKSKRTKSR